MGKLAEQRMDTEVSLSEAGHSSDEANSRDGMADMQSNDSLRESDGSINAESLEALLEDVRPSSTVFSVALTSIKLWKLNRIFVELPLPGSVSKSCQSRFCPASNVIDVHRLDLCCPVSHLSCTSCNTLTGGGWRDWWATVEATAQLWGSRRLWSANGNSSG